MREYYRGVVAVGSSGAPRPRIPSRHDRPRHPRRPAPAQVSTVRLPPTLDRWDVLPLAEMIAAGQGERRLPLKVRQTVPTRGHAVGPGKLPSSIDAR
jgi:hypothetical protein